MKIISLFNNKGGVGKTTLAFHLSHALAELGYKVLMMDLDPQCNLTLCGMNDEQLQDVWREEDSYIDDFSATKERISNEEFLNVIKNPRTVHFLLKPTEEGTGELELLPPPQVISDNLDLIPGRLTLHMYEDKIAQRWTGIYIGDPLSIRTVTKIRAISEMYANEYKYDFTIVDTSPSLGILNKVVISTVDGFLIPCLPDMFSLYGIRNIGNYLTNWKKEFDTIFSLISDEKRKNFPLNFVQFLGFTIYNAKKYQNPEKWDLAQAHYNYAMQIPAIIKQYIKDEVRNHLTIEMIDNPIGGTSIMHSHNTFPNMAQKYKLPIWLVPEKALLEPDDVSTIRGNRAAYEQSKVKYFSFTRDLLNRISTLN